MHTLISLCVILMMFKTGPVDGHCQVTGRSFGDFGGGSVSWMALHGAMMSDVPPNGHEQMIDIDVDDR